MEENPLSRFCNPTNGNKSAANEAENIPNVLFASDGRKFFPCKYCCRAFAYKSGLTSHVKSCSFRVVNVSDSEDEDDRRRVKRESMVTPNISVKSESAKKSETKQYDVEIFINSVNSGQRNDSKTIKVWENLLIQPSKGEQTDSVSVHNYKPRTVVNEKPKQIKKPPKKHPTHFGKVIEINKEVPCGICSQMFKSSLELLRHKREIHIGKKIKLSAESLKIYDKIFRASGRNVCPICAKPAKMVRWQRHLATHSADLKFFCSICKKGFNRIDHLRDHEKRHVIEVDEV